MRISARSLAIVGTLVLALAPAALRARQEGAASTAQEPAAAQESAAVQPAADQAQPAADQGQPAAAAGMEEGTAAPTIPSAASANPLDPEAATEAYLATMTPEQKARSDSYFEGGYWLQLWGFLYGLGVAWLLLGTRLSAKMRDLAERITRFRPLSTGLYAIQYILLTTVLAFPLTVYQGFFREHTYGLSNQTFGQWMGDQGKGLGLSLVLVSLGLMALYGVLRRAPRTWWIWGAIVMVALLAVVILIGPVFIEPLFNKYTPLEDPAVKAPILAMARANGIPVDNVWVEDASKQSKRISAHVGGFLGTERVVLNDNLLNRTSLPEIEAVMGHEMGHYVLHHVYELLLEFGLVIVVGFAFLRWSFDRVRRRWGAGWGVQGIGDVAGLPLLGALLAIFFFFATPVTNTIIRSNEAEADIFGLNAAQQPDGFARAALDLAEYRKLSPGPVEEWIFYDHPSGRDRILMAMRWKAAHLAEGQGGAQKGAD
jgi:Zn-dependent protease with chaperone function